ncbi:MAG: hypothetical protein ACRELF_18125, partial [Gemmataceae bacterium]
MWLTSLRRMITGKSRSPQFRRAQPQRPRFIPRLDYLEERIVPSTIDVAAGDTAGLISAINQANTDSANGIADTIQLTDSTYTINGTNGALPVITATNLTIDGQGATLNGSFSGRLFYLGSGAGVTLESLTLTDGQVSGTNAQGGAIYDAGNNLTMQSVTVKTNIAFATGVTANGAGNNAQGGGLYVSGGTVDLTNCTLTDNSVVAATGIAGGAGGNAQGGGIYATNGAILVMSGGSVINDGLSAGNGGTGTTNNPIGGAGGNAQGGGIYAQGGSVTLTQQASVTDNSIFGGNAGAGSAGAAGGAGGNIDGGGVYASNTTTVVVAGGA